MPAEKVNTSFEQGTTVSISFSLTNEDGSDYDLSSSTARAQMRKHYDSVNSTPFSCYISNSVITLSLTPAQSSNVEAGRYVYDVEVVDSSNNVKRVVEGLITVYPEVTK